MKNLFIFILCLVSFDAFAGYKVYSSDPKWPTNKSIEYQLISDPIAIDADYILNDQVSGSVTATVATTFLNQPDVPRNVYVTPGGTTTDIEACSITVSGTNIFGQSISDTLALTANQSATTIGVKAFKTVSSISIPAACQSGGAAATFDFGVGEKLGLNRCLDRAGDVFFSQISGAKEATGPTMVVDVDEVEKNTADFSGTMDGSADFGIFFMQNYRCVP